MMVIKSYLVNQEDASLQVNFVVYQALLEERRLRLSQADNGGQASNAWS